MPYVRKTRVNVDATRQKIRAAYLIRRLQQHVAGKVKLDASQVRSIEILLKKIVPDLNQTEVTGEITHRAIVEVPPLLTKDEWLKKYRTHRLEGPTTIEVNAEPLPQLEPPPTKQ
jgi:hypothetical protein